MHWSASVSSLSPRCIRCNLAHSSPTVYKDLPHPPTSFLGTQFVYRAPDGGYNNPLQPDLGRAGQPYARTVTPLRSLPLASLPDPGLVFDALLKRDTVRLPIGRFIVFISLRLKKHAVHATSFRHLVTSVLLCRHYHPRSVSHQPPEALDQRHIVVSRPIASLWVNQRRARCRSLERWSRPSI